MNPYQPPQANVDQPLNERASTPVVIATFLVGAGLSFTVQTLSGVVLSWVFVGSGTAVEDLYMAMTQSTAFNLWAHALNVAVYMATGAMAAWLRPASAVPTAAYTGGLMVAFVLIQYLVPYSHQAPLWSHVLTLAMPIPAVVAGAWLWNRRSTA